MPNYKTIFYDFLLTLSLFALCAILPLNAAPLLLLNEIMSADNSEFPDEDGEYGDWIELINAGDAPVDLAGWGLSDDPAEPFKWVLPSGTLPAGALIVVWASGKDHSPEYMHPPQPLTLIASNSIWRFNDNGATPDPNWSATNFNDSAWQQGQAMLGYGAPGLVTTIVSYGHNSNQKYPATYFRRSFNFTGKTSEIRGAGMLNLWADDGAIVYLNGTEVLRVRMPLQGVTHKTYATEIVHSRGQWESFQIPLEQLRHGVNVMAVQVHQINDTSSDLCFWLELKARQSQLHTNFKISAGNETITLTTPDGVTADTAPSMSVMRDASFGRVAGDAGGAWVILPTPTPGTANSVNGYMGLLEPPTLSIAPGFYDTPITVALTHTDPLAQIYYTLDGSTPTNATTARCFQYTAPLQLSDRTSLPNYFSMFQGNPPNMSNHTQYGWLAPEGKVPKIAILRATAFRSGYYTPRETAGTWFIGTNTTCHLLPVFSLQSDEANLFSDATGLFVPGDIFNTLGWNGHSVGLPNANYFQRGDAWERPVMAQFFDKNHTLAFTQKLGVRNHGGWSRAAAQKTMRFYARGEYGDSKTAYPLFPSQSDALYKRFLLRNSGNDWSSTGLRDAMMQQLFRPMARTATQDYQPTVVYINGEYWGILNLREYYSKYLLQRKYGVDPDNLDLLKAVASSESMEIDEGDDLHYKAVLNYIKTNNMALAEHLNWVEERMDLDDLIDHYACEIYCCNTDWPGNNLGLWRVRTPYSPNAPYGHDGRWRWLMYDTDHGFGLSSKTSTDMMFQARRSDRGKCQPQFDRLLSNTTFRNRFVNRFADLLNTAFVPARVTSIIDENAARIESEIPRHIARWQRMLSFNDWKFRIQDLRNFANGRVSNAFSNVANEFGLGGTALLTLNISNGLGKITINTITLDSETPGIANKLAPYPWSGTYFRNVPLTITAQPAYGYVFSHWETSQGVMEDEAITLTLNDNADCLAVFETATPPKITINEVMADANKSSGFLHPATGKAADWFELLNETPETVDLSGYWLEDDNPSNGCRIPNGVLLAPGACLCVWTGSDFSTGRNPDGSINATFGLSKGGDAVVLLTPDQSHELDRVAFGQQLTNVSQGRWGNGADGEWVSFERPTPGLPNRNPTMTTGVLPSHPLQSVSAGELLNISFALPDPLIGGAYSIVQGVANATINPSGLFSWQTPTNTPNQIYEFRIMWLGIVDGNAVTDETTMLVFVNNTIWHSIETITEPNHGGAVYGGGIYVDNTPVTLSVEAAPGWRFKHWGDGVTDPTRRFIARRNALYTAHFAYGLNAPTNLYGTWKDSEYLLYWSAVNNAEGYVVKRANSLKDTYTEIARPVANVWRELAPPEGQTAYYIVTTRYSEYESDPSERTQILGSGITRHLTGNVIGSLGSWNNIVDRTREMAFDGNINTYYDAAAQGGWPGLDLGVEAWRFLTHLRYVPRADFPQRMVNGSFQVSGSSDGVSTFDAPSTLHTIVSQPPINVYTVANLNTTHKFRYLRYLPPSGGNGNIAELEFYGHDALPQQPTNLQAVAAANGGIALNWGSVEKCNGYLIRRTTQINGVYEAIAYVEAENFLDNTLPDNATRYYKIAALNRSGQSALSAIVSATTLPAPVLPAFINSPNGGSGIRCVNGQVYLRLSGALDPRVELVCAESLAIPSSKWVTVPDAAYSSADDGSGAIIISITTNAPQLFFKIRLK